MATKPASDDIVGAVGRRNSPNRLGPGSRSCLACRRRSNLGWNRCGCGRCRRWSLGGRGGPGTGGAVSMTSAGADWLLSVGSGSTDSGGRSGLGSDAPAHPAARNPTARMPTTRSAQRGRLASDRRTPLVLFKAKVIWLRYLHARGGISRLAHYAGARGVDHTRLRSRPRQWTGVGIPVDRRGGAPAGRRRGHSPQLNSQIEVRRPSGHCGANYRARPRGSCRGGRRGRACLRRPAGRDHPRNDQPPACAGGIRGIFVGRFSRDGGPQRRAGSIADRP